MNLCLCVLCSHRPRIIERLFLVIIFLYLVLGKLFRLCFVFIFCIDILCLPWHLVHFFSSFYHVRFILIRCYVATCLIAFNCLYKSPFLIRLQFTRLIKCLRNISSGLAWYFLRSRFFLALHSALTFACRYTYLVSSDENLV